MHKYSPLKTAIANIPYVAMIILGSITIAYTHAFSAAGLAVTGIYIVYGIAGAFWIMIFVCPYCRYYASKGCPCGYGMVSSKIVKQGDCGRFASKFRRHIPVIVPLLVIPIVYGGIGLWRSFSWPFAALVLVFFIESFIILPLVSRKQSCVECPQKDQCPWMAKESR